MAGKKSKYDTITTPKGVLCFPKLNTPDTKYKAEGEYTAKIRLSAEDSAPLLKKLEPLAAQAVVDTRAKLEAELEEATGAKKGKIKVALGKLAQADLPAKPVYDDDGEATGEYEFNFKMAAQFKDQKTGKVRRLSPAIFDAAAVQMKNPPDIWGGTEARVNGFLKPFYNAALNAAGVSLRLSGVQIITLVSAGQRSAEQFGFGKEEGGYAAPEKDPDDDAPDSPALTGGADSPSEDDEF